MGKKETLLCNILQGTKGERFQVNDTSLKNLDHIKKIYTELGGCSNKIPLRIGNFDIKLQNDHYLELDEQLHFNRYRLITLKSDIYLNCKSFNVDFYKKSCQIHEIDCLNSGGYGGKWKNDSTEKLFLKSSPNKDLNGNGSSRWKQRAFYDFIKDCFALENKIILQRVSIWETIPSKIKIKDILDKEMEQHYNELRTFILNKFKD
jgi:hypothetical protein